MIDAVGKIVRLMVCALALSQAAFAGAGRCDNADLQWLYFPTDPDGKLDRVHAARAIRDQTPIYQDAESNQVVATLDFNAGVRALEFQQSRVLVGPLDTGLAPIGWVETSALLCGIVPLKGASGLEQRLYIRPSSRGERAASDSVKAFPAPEFGHCGDTGCRELAAFARYFVFDFDEDTSMFLIGEDYTLHETSQLSGWIRRDDVVVWDSAYGLRPRENLVFPASHPFAGAERMACAYATPEEAVNSPVERCLPVPGGERWFLSGYRIPMFERIQFRDRELYRVLLDSAMLPKTEFPSTRQIVGEAYIPVSADIVEDVWLMSDDLDRWVGLLRDVNIERLAGLAGEELRQAFVFALVDALEAIFRKPLFENITMPLHDYVSRNGLPVRADSPLFRYSVAELLDADAVPECELGRLLAWISASRQFLNIVYHGNARPVYETVEFPGSCDTANTIPYIPGEILTAPLGSDENMRYNHTFQKTNVYWVPKEFLP